MSGQNYNKCSTNIHVYVYTSTLYMVSVYLIVNVDQNRNGDFIHYKIWNDIVNYITVRSSIK